MNPNLTSILPFAIAAGWAVFMLMIGLILDKEYRYMNAWTAAVGLVIAALFTIPQFGSNNVGFDGMVAQDGFSGFLTILFVVAGLIAIAMSYDYNQRVGIHHAEFYALLLLSISGMMLLVIANNLILVFMGIELMSLPLYVLCAFLRPRAESEESALKYFLLGTFASAFMLYGVALIFGATQSVWVAGIVGAVQAGMADTALLVIGAVMLLVGFAFKVALIPFHNWAPDVYQGAPTPVSGFMAVAVKAAGFGVMLRILITAFPSLSVQLQPVIVGLSALTMVLGNLLAVSQRNIKRMLAYSSITHAGYLMMTVVAAGRAEFTTQAVGAILFYLVAYAASTFGAWSVVTALEQSDGHGNELEDFSGAGTKYPWLGICMLIFMISLTGIPVTLGFWGKLFLFRTAAEAGFTLLALAGLVMSLLSAFYYLRVIIFMFMRPGEPKVRRDTLLTLVTIIMAALLVGLSLVPNQLLQLAMRAVLALQ